MSGLSVKKEKHEKGYTPSWTAEVYEVSTKETLPHGVMYTVKDLLGEDLEGRFYPWELQKVPYPDKENVPIEVLEIKGSKAKVHYVGWPDKFDEWILKRNLVKHG